MISVAWFNNGTRVVLAVAAFGIAARSVWFTRHTQHQGRLISLWTILAMCLPTGITWTYLVATQPAVTGTLAIGAWLSRIADVFMLTGCFVMQSLIRYAEQARTTQSN